MAISDDRWNTVSQPFTAARTENGSAMSPVTTWISACTSAGSSSRLPQSLREL